MKTKIRIHTSNPIDDRVRVSLDMCYKAELTNILLCDQLTETGRVRQSAVIYYQIRLVYSKSGVIAYERSTRATN